MTAEERSPTLDLVTGDALEEADAHLVALVLAGDERAFRPLYDRWRPAVFRVARAFAELDGGDVDDVVQETFIRAHRALALLQDRARFGPWLLSIARNCAFSRLAHRGATARLADGFSREVAALAEGDAGPYPKGSREAELELVRSIIAQLPDGPEKDTVHLFYVEGEYSAAQIAARLGVGKSAITMRLERFRAKVRRRLLAEVAKLRGEESSE